MLNNKILSAAIVAWTAGWAAAAAPAGTLGAQARLEAMAATSVAGTVDITQRDGVVVVTARLTGLTPGLHAFHVHQHGRCDDGGRAAGAHFDPSDGTGRGERSEHHGGEFGALTADQDGRAQLSLVLSSGVMSLEDPARGVVGRSIVVHGSPDDYIDGPGPAKGRILACGVIRAVGNA